LRASVRHSASPLFAAMGRKTMVPPLLDTSLGLIRRHVVHRMSFSRISVSMIEQSQTRVPSNRFALSGLR